MEKSTPNREFEAHNVVLVDEGFITPGAGDIAPGIGSTKKYFEFRTPNFRGHMVGNGVRGNCPDIVLVVIVDRTKLEQASYAEDRIRTRGGHEDHRPREREVARHEHNVDGAKAEELNILIEHLSD
ncbi:hypothetical protein CRG98_036925 [Punica granatum]|uniref:Uncharacterized protein n=1 Tax=Punica granatum TaxID=22663 RepID=A0A2I0IFS3_PUNGR|nr:hypothetical protein CRG98_036925 [Punica granatum]